MKMINDFYSDKYEICKFVTTNIRLILITFCGSIHHFFGGEGHRQLHRI